MPSLDIWNCQLRSADLQTEKNSHDSNRDMGVVGNEPTQSARIPSNCSDSYTSKQAWQNPSPISLNGKPLISCPKIPPPPPPQSLPTATRIQRRTVIGFETHTHAWVHTCIHIQTYAHMNYIQACTHAHAHTHTHTHTHHTFQGEHLLSIATSMSQSVAAGDYPHPKVYGEPRLPEIQQQHNSMLWVSTSLCQSSQHRARNPTFPAPDTQHSQTGLATPSGLFAHVETFPGWMQDIVQLAVQGWTQARVITAGLHTFESVSF